MRSHYSAPQLGPRASARAHRPGGGHRFPAVQNGLFAALAALFFGCLDARHTAVIQPVHRPFDALLGQFVARVVAPGLVVATRHVQTNKKIQIVRWLGH